MDQCDDRSMTRIMAKIMDKFLVCEEKEGEG